MPASIAAICCIFIVGVIVGWSNLPIVQFSWHDEKCVKVIGKGDCNNLPEKYIHEWVK